MGALQYVLAAPVVDRPAARRCRVTGAHLPGAHLPGAHRCGVHLPGTGTHPRPLLDEADHDELRLGVVQAGGVRGCRRVANYRIGEIHGHRPSDRDRYKGPRRRRRGCSDAGGVARSVSLRSTAARVPSRSRSHPTR